MLVKDFITKEIPVLKSSDKGKYALELMDDYKVRHLPWLVEDLGTYQALVSEKSLLAAADLSLTLAELNPADCWSVHPDALFPDAVDIMSRHNLSLLPVVGEKAEYQGVLTQEKAFQVLALYSQMESAGCVITLRIAPIDYSVSEIARILESNHAILLSLLSTTLEPDGYLEVVLKIYLEDPSAVIRSFERFNYTVTDISAKENLTGEIFQQRINEFIHYINI